MSDATSHTPDPAAPPPICPHCNQPMTRMTVPEMSKFDSPWIYVCFNDECGYYKRGWEWMESHFGSKTSYRHKHDPFTGEQGPLPVWSDSALRDHIILDDES